MSCKLCNMVALPEILEAISLDLRLIIEFLYTVLVSDQNGFYAVSQSVKKVH